MIIKKGINAFTTFSMLILLTLQPVNKIAPTGGVMQPIQRLKVIIIPKCTGFIPKLFAIGSSMGVNIKIAGVGSIKVPNTKSKIFIIIKTIIGLWDMLKSAEANKEGILTNAKIQDIMEESAIKNKIMLVSFAASKKIFGKSFIFIVL